MYKDGSVIPKFKDNEAKGSAPSDASRKLAKLLLPSKGTGKVDHFCIRQKSHGRFHNKVFCYRAEQKMVEAPKHMVKVTGSKNKLREIKVYRQK